MKKLVSDDCDLDDFVNGLRDLFSDYPEMLTADTLRSLYLAQSRYFNALNKYFPKKIRDIVSPKDEKAKLAQQKELNVLPDPKIGKKIFKHGRNRD